MMSHIQNLKYDTNELIYETETDSQTYKQTCGCQGRVWVEEGWIGSLRLADANYYIYFRKTELFGYTPETNTTL